MQRAVQSNTTTTRADGIKALFELPVEKIVFFKLVIAEKTDYIAGETGVTQQGLRSIPLISPILVSQISPPRFSLSSATVLIAATV
ncbi:MAG: hypothetical protein H6925_04625 [Holosporaceae bacterium]|nr:MAG: hypothetical protein H6925_04625 [Holosporaceae bacterium]